MSRGYTKAFAKTAPVAPATARPQGGIAASFDCPAMAIFVSLLSSVCRAVDSVAYGKVHSQPVEGESASSDVRLNGEIKALKISSPKISVWNPTKVLSAWVRERTG